MAAVQDDRDLLDQIQREVAKLETAVISVGFQGQSALEQAGENAAATVVDVATFNEFGTIDIPERPFMRFTFDQHQAAIVERVEIEHSAVIVGERKAVQALSRIAIFLVGLIQRTMRESPSWAEPNAPATIRKKTVAGKRGDVPLLDTGQLRASVSWVVRIGGSVAAEGMA